MEVGVAGVPRELMADLEQAPLLDWRQLGFNSHCSHGSFAQWQQQWCQKGTTYTEGSSNTPDHTLAKKPSPYTTHAPWASTHLNSNPTA